MNDGALELEEAPSKQERKEKGKKRIIMMKIIKIHFDDLGHRATLKWTKKKQNKKKIKK